MNTVTYGIVEERYSLDGSSRLSYGIAAYSDSQENGTAFILTSVADISSDKKQVEELVVLCNRCQLSPTHLYEVIEDFLAQ